jgi:hypothetical protein
MSEANLKQAFRTLVKAHIAHAASNKHGGDRTAATSNARKAFQTALNAYVKGTVTHDMRIRYLLNKHYVTNVNKNYLVSLLKNIPANKVSIQKHLNENEGYYFGPIKNSNQQVIRPPISAAIRKVTNLTVAGGKWVASIPGATATGMRRMKRLVVKKPKS